MTEGIPHRVMDEDVYHGRVIPKGTLVFANIWWVDDVSVSADDSQQNTRKMSRDAKLFANPNEFVPERFLGHDGESNKNRNPTSFVFGFGRR